MRLLIPALLLLLVALVAESADVVCGSKKTKKTVTLRKGDSVAFSTQAGAKYGKKANCAVMFKRSRKQKCKLTFSCSSFDLTAANSGCTKKSDFILISKKKYCKSNSPSVTVTGTKLKVLFKSHKKSQGGLGATCTASCTSASSPATTAAPGGTSCEDKNESCTSWANAGECDNNPGYMLVNCQKACQICTGVATTTAGVCCPTCSLVFPAVPHFHGTVHSIPQTITEDDVSEFVQLAYSGEGTAEMWGPNGWDSGVAVHQYQATFSEAESAVLVQCDMEVGSEQECRQLADKFSRALGRVPWYARAGTQGLDLRPGDYSVTGCNAWGGSGTITMCAGVGTTLQARGNLEELLLHEGAHVTLDPLLLHTARWRCAQLSDQNYISSYARDNPGREDLSESLVPWHAWHSSSQRVDAATIAAISSAIPARLELLTSFLTSSSLRQELAAVERGGQQKVTPHVIGAAA